MKSKINQFQNEIRDTFLVRILEKNAENPFRHSKEVYFDSFKKTFDEFNNIIQQSSMKKNFDFEFIESNEDISIIFYTLDDNDEMIKNEDYLTLSLNIFTEKLYFVTTIDAGESTYHPIDLNLSSSDFRSILERNISNIMKTNLSAYKNTIKA